MPYDLPDRPVLSTADAYDEAFFLYRSHFARFATIGALTTVPVTAMVFVLERMLGVDAVISDIVSGQGNRSEDLGAVILALTLYIAANVVGLLAYVLQTCALVAYASSVMLQRPCSVFEAYQKGWTHFGRVLGSYLLLGLLVSAILMGILFAGMTMVGLAAAVPGGSDIPIITIISVVMLLALGTILMLVAGAGAFIPQISVIEGVAYLEAFRRNWQLVRSQLGRVLGSILLLWLLGAVVQSAFALSVGATLTGVVYPALGWGEEAQSVTLNILGASAELVVQPYISAALTVLYYNLRFRNEAQDILWWLDHRSTPAPA